MISQNHQQCEMHLDLTSITHYSTLTHSILQIGHPIHDSFIVRSGYQSSLEAQMKASFKKIVNTTTNLKIKGPLLSEHFYSKPKSDSGGVILNAAELWEPMINHDSKFSIYTNYLSYWHKWHERQ